MCEVCVEIVSAQNGRDADGLGRRSDNDAVCVQRWGVQREEDEEEKLL